MVVKEIKIPIYRGRLIFLAYHNAEDMMTWVLEHCKDFDLGTDLKDYDGGFFVYRGVQYIAFHIEGNVTPGVIAHECKHALNELYMDRHIMLDPHNDEPECYLLGWYVDEAHAFWEEVKQKHLNQ